MILVANADKPKSMIVSQISPSVLSTFIIPTVEVARVFNFGKHINDLVDSLVEKSTEKLQLVVKGVVDEDENLQFSLSDVVEQAVNLAVIDLNIYQQSQISEPKLKESNPIACQVAEQIDWQTE